VMVRIPLHTFHTISVGDVGGIRRTLTRAVTVASRSRTRLGVCAAQPGKQKQQRHTTQQQRSTGQGAACKMAAMAVPGAGEHA
jgi:hypothetical protein